MTYILSVNITLTIMFMLMKHPLSMGMVLLMQTIMISTITTGMNQNSWFSYILFLIMVGGMLILFMYMTSIASNEKFKMTALTSTAPIIALISAITIHDSTKTALSNMETTTLNTITKMEMSMNKFISFPLATMLLFMMIYLLIALIATVKITDFKQGSIRQMN